MEDSVPSLSPSSSPALGTITKLSSGPLYSGLEATKRRERLISRYSDQDQARRLVPSERVSICLRRLRPNISLVEVWGDRDKQTAHYRNLTLCGSVWMCPVCSANISEVRRDDLDRLITTARDWGMVVALETLTARHYRDYALKPLLKSLLAARAAFTSGRLRDDATNLYRLIGRVTALEATRTIEHGWHPHFHSVLFFDSVADLAGYRERMSRAWLSILQRFGLDGNGHAYDLRETSGAVSDYVAKWGHEPAYERPWGVAAELTKWHLKRGRLTSSMTPFQLLQASRDVPEAGSLFREYCEAFKGRHQLQWSRGLRAMLLGDVPEVSDEEAAKGSADEQRYMLAALMWREFQVVKANSARGELLAAALAGDDQLLAFMQALGLRLGAS